MEIDLENSEMFVFCSPFLAAIESATAIIKGLEQSKIESINVQDQLSDILMKSWYPNNDPFIGLTTKLTTNKEPFTAFLKSEYNLTGPLSLEYKRNALIQYPETVEQNYLRYS